MEEIFVFLIIKLLKFNLENLFCFQPNGFSYIKIIYLLVMINILYLAYFTTNYLICWYQNFVISNKTINEYHFHLLSWWIS